MFEVFGFYKFKKLTTLKKNKILLQDFLVKKNIRDFNTYVSNDKRVEQIILPLGDGMTVCRVL